VTAGVFRLHSALKLARFCFDAVGGKTGATCRGSCSPFFSVLPP
jgi:hypothetical protein